RAPSASTRAASERARDRSRWERVAVMGARVRCSSASRSSSAASRRATSRSWRSSARRSSCPALSASARWRCARLRARSRMTSQVRTVPRAAPSRRPSRSIDAPFMGPAHHAGATDERHHALAACASDLLEREGDLGGVGASAAVREDDGYGLIIRRDECSLGPDIGERMPAPCAMRHPVRTRRRAPMGEQGTAAADGAGPSGGGAPGRRPAGRRIGRRVGQVLLALVLVALLIWGILFFRVLVLLPRTAQEQADQGYELMLKEFTRLAAADADVL